MVGQLQIPGGQDPKANSFKLFEAWLRDRRKGRWLLILDNADDARFLRQPPPSNYGTTDDALTGATRQSILEYLPICEHGSILITTRSKHTATQLVDRRDVIGVPPMDEEHATQLLEKKLGQQQNGEYVAALARELDYIPLAITQAAAYIEQRGGRCSVQQYLERLQKNDKSKMSLLDQDDGNLRRDEGASNSVLLTWQISFEHIREVRPSAADLLSLMSLFDRQAIPEPLLKERSAAHYGDLTAKTAKNHDNNDEDGNESDTSSEDGDDFLEMTFDDQFEDDVTMLLGYSFIAVTTDVAAFEMHRLVQLATQRWLAAKGQLKRWQQQFISSLHAAFPTGNYENWDICQTLFPHAKSALLLRFREPKVSLHWAAVMYRAAWFALEKGNAWDAEEMARCSQKARAREVGQEHEDTLSSMAMVASSYRNQGRWEEAEELEVQVIETRKKKLGADHPDTLTSMANLAATYWNQGRWEEAEELEVQVMETRKTKLGADHPDTLTSMANLGVTYSMQGKEDKAEVLKFEVMETSKTKLGADHPDTLTSMANLAATYRNQGRWEEAEELDLQVMETRKTKLGADHPSTLTSMANLGVTYSIQGKEDKAEVLKFEVMETSKTKLGADYPSTLTSMANLAATYWNQGR